MLLFQNQQSQPCLSSPNILQMVLDPALCSVLVLNGSRCHLYLKWLVHNSTDGMQIFQHIHIDAVNRTMYAVHAVH